MEEGGRWKKLGVIMMERYNFMSWKPLIRKVKVLEQTKLSMDRLS